MIPTMIAAIVKMTSCSHGIANTISFTRDREQAAEHDAEHEPERRADQRGDHALVPDHPPHLTPRHADRAEHAELARPLEDRQDERVDDPEQADHDREGEQHVEDVEHLLEARRPGCP